MSGEFMIVLIKIIGNLRFDHNVAILVTFFNVTIVNVQTGSYHFCFILVITIFISLKLVEDSISFIVSADLNTVWDPLGTNDFIIFIVIHRIEPVSWFDSIVNVVEENDFHSDDVDLEFAMGVFVIAIKMIYTIKRHDVRRPRNFILNNLTVNLIRAHLSPLKVLTKFICVIFFLLWIHLVQRTTPS